MWDKEQHQAIRCPIQPGILLSLSLSTTVSERPAKRMTLGY